MRRKIREGVLKNLICYQHFVPTAQSLGFQIVIRLIDLSIKPDWNPYICLENYLKSDAKIKAGRIKSLIGRGV